MVSSITHAIRRSSGIQAGYATASAHLGQVDEQIEEREELLGVLEAERTKLIRERDKLYDLYQSGMIDKRGFGETYGPLTERATQLDEEIPKAQAELDAMRITQLSQTSVVTEAQDLFTRWPTLPFPERRRIVEAITERITVGEDDIEIDLYYAPGNVVATP